MRPFATVILCSLLVGCVSANTSVDRLNTALVNFDKNFSAMVVQPADGGSLGKTYRGSGAKVAFEFARAMKPLVADVKISPNSSDNQSLFEDARKQNVRYLLIPQIMHWEDRATQWSGIPDRMEIQVELIDLVTGDTLDTSSISSNSSDVEFTDAPVGEMVRSAADRYFQSLQGVEDRGRRYYSRYTPGRP
ncbi:MAG: DUF4823 domain-containing protein [Nitrospinota bacterium]|nr:DUF4823 domain-containing protein [Nitrospinota bacterium]